MGGAAKPGDQDALVTREPTQPAGTGRAVTARRGRTADQLDVDDILDVLRRRSRLYLYVTLGSAPLAAGLAAALFLAGIDGYRVVVAVVGVLLGTYAVARASRRRMMVELDVDEGVLALIERAERALNTRRMRRIDRAYAEEVLARVRESWRT